MTVSPNSAGNRYRTALLLLIALSLTPASHFVSAQPTRPSNLDEILLRLEQNLRTYDSKVPSLFCDEHVVSKKFPGPDSQVTITDSIFRLKRVAKPDHSSTLDESRLVKTVDGRPAEAQDLAGPTIVSGAFSGGLAAVSSGQSACMSYALKPPHPNHPRAPYTVRFKSLYSKDHPDHCLLQEDGTGRIFIDPVSLQITRMELTAPRHVIFPPRESPAGEPIPAIVGEWILAVDYAPVLLSGQTFWLPATITSHATTGSGGPNATVWTFNARYSNYHKLEVTSRILPASNATP